MAKVTRTYRLDENTTKKIEELVEILQLGSVGKVDKSVVVEEAIKKMYYEFFGRR
jgi:hypothetical protein